VTNSAGRTLVFVTCYARYMALRLTRLVSGKVVGRGVAVVLVRVNGRRLPLAFRVAWKAVRRSEDPLWRHREVWTG
jgi:hypothetical protein